MDAQPTLLVEELLATASITRLIATDALTRKPRWLLVRRLRARNTPVAEELDALAGCPYCASMYVAAGVLLLRNVPGWGWVRRALAIRWAVGVLSTKVAGDSPDWPPELSWPAHREPGAFEAGDGTLVELRTEREFWKRHQPSTLGRAMRRDTVEATINQFEKLNEIRGAADRAMK